MLLWYLHESDFLWRTLELRLMIRFKSLKLPDELTDLILKYFSKVVF
jgi:hypothetical protein